MVLKVFVNRPSNPAVYSVVREVPDELFGAGFVEGGNDESRRMKVAYHYVLVEVDDNVMEISTNDVWNGTIKVIHPDMEN